MLKKFNQNNDVIYNQLKSKLLYKNVYSYNNIKSIIVNVNLFKLKSFNDDVILETSFLIEYLTSLKSFINFYKRMYQEVNLQIASNLRGTYIFYFLFLLKIFYFPILRRRNLVLPDSFDTALNYSFTLNSINTFSFVPDIYFKWNNSINISLKLLTYNKNKSKLLLTYWNFPFSI